MGKKGNISFLTVEIVEGNITKQNREGERLSNTEEGRVVGNRRQVYCPRKKQQWQHAACKKKTEKTKTGHHEYN